MQFAGDHRSTRRIIVVALFAMLAALTVTTAGSVQSAQAGPTPPITIDGDPCGANDWETIPGVDVQPDLNSTATTVSGGYDCAGAQTDLSTCTNSTTDDIFAQNEPSAKFNSTIRPRVPTSSNPTTGLDICQTYYFGSVDPDGDFWLCSAMTLFESNGTGKIWFEFNQSPGTLTVGDIAVRLDRQGGGAANPIVYQWDGTAWVQSNSPVLQAQSQNPQWFAEVCINLTQSGLVQAGACVGFGAGSGYTATGNSLTAQLKDTGGVKALNIQNCGTLVITKAGGDTDSFTYTINGLDPGDPSFGELGANVLITDADPGVLLGNSSETWTAVASGTYAIAEGAVPAGWVNTSTICVNADGTETGADALIIAGETTTCTITNLRYPRITVTKATNPAGTADSFGFDTTGDLVANETLVDGDSFTDQTTAASSRTVTELDTAGWLLTGAICNTAVGAVGTLTGTTLTIDGADLELGDPDISCTFTNTGLREVVVTKAVSGDNPPADAMFTITVTCTAADGVTTLTNSGTVSDTGTVTLADVPIGYTCAASEADPGGDWNPTIPADITVTADGPNDLLVANVYEAVRDVVATKIVTGDNRPTDAMFEITTAPTTSPSPTTTSPSASGQPCHGPSISSCATAPVP